MPKSSFPLSFHEEVARLQATHSDSRALANAIATLLWQYGDKPTAHKVLQYAGQGSMATINDELTKWWDATRKRDLVRLQNPGMPQSLVDQAGNLLGQMWNSCMALAQEALEQFREEASQQVKEAESAAEAARAESRRYQETADVAVKMRETVEQDLAVERAAKEAALAGQESWRQKAEAVNLEMERLRAEQANELERMRSLQAKEMSEARTDFKEQLDTMRQSLKDTEYQFDEMRKQNLLEISAIRTRNVELREATQKAEKALAAVQDNERALYKKQNELTLEIKNQERTIGERTAKLESAQGEIARLTTALSDQKSAFEFSRAEQQGQIDMLRNQLEQLMPMSELRELLQAIKKPAERD